MIFPTANLLGFNLWGRLVTRKCTPRKTGTVLQPCWDLSLLGCKAGLMQCGWLMVDRIEALHYSLGFAQSRHLTPGAPRKGSISIHLQHGGPMIRKSLLDSFNDTCVACVLGGSGVVRISEFSVMLCWYFQDLVLSFHVACLLRAKILGKEGKKISGQFDTWLGMFGPHLN